MTSPDVRAYIDLAIYDRSPEQLVDTALADAAAKMPGWVPRQGNTEVVLLQAKALITAELIYALNRMPGTVAEVQARLFGLTRSDGVAATTEVTFTLADTAGHTIPAGTRLRLPMGGESDDLVITTDVDLVVAASSSTGTVAATAETNTDEANGTAAGTALDLLDPGLSFVDTVELDTAIAGGVNPEDAVAFLNRAMQRFRRITDALVNPDQFTAFALEDPAVTRAITYQRVRGDTGATADGHVTTAVAGAGGALLSGGAKTALEGAMQEAAPPHLEVWVVDPEITDVDVTVAVMRLTGYSNSEVEANVTAALVAYLNPDSWLWGDTVRRFELVSVIDQAVGVDYVVSLTTPASDVSLTGIAPLVTAGTIDVTVDEP